MIFHKKELQMTSMRMMKDVKSTDNTRSEILKILNPHMDTQSAELISNAILGMIKQPPVSAEDAKIILETLYPDLNNILFKELLSSRLDDFKTLGYALLTSVENQDAFDEAANDFIEALNILQKDHADDKEIEDLITLFALKIEGHLILHSSFLFDYFRTILQDINKKTTDQLSACLTKKPLAKENLINDTEDLLKRVDKQNDYKISPRSTPLFELLNQDLDKSAAAELSIYIQERLKKISTVNSTKKADELQNLLETIEPIITNDKFKKILSKKSEFYQIGIIYLKPFAKKADFGESVNHLFGALSVLQKDHCESDVINTLINHYSDCVEDTLLRSPEKLFEYFHHIFYKQTETAFVKVKKYLEDQIMTPAINNSTFASFLQSHLFPLTKNSEEKTASTPDLNNQKYRR